MCQLPTLEGVVTIEKEVGFLSLTIQFPVFQIMEGVGELCRAARMCGGVSVCAQSSGIVQLKVLQDKISKI